jgi:HPt (histidine-containing phosphotransfer) domain-containing protein
VEKKIDMSYLEEVAAGDEEFLLDLIRTFIRQVPEFLENMKKYLENKEFFLLAREAHTAKSSVLLFGLHELSAKLKEFQLLAAKAENPETYPDYIREFEENCQQVIGYLRTHFHI